MNLQIKPIRTAADHKVALHRINSLMDAQANTPEADELEILAMLVEIYEEEHFPMDLPTSAEAIKFRMDQAGLSAQQGLEESADLYAELCAEDQDLRQLTQTALIDWPEWVHLNVDWLWIWSRPKARKLAKLD